MLTVFIFIATIRCADPSKELYFKKRIFVFVYITLRKSARTVDFREIIGYSRSESKTFSENGSFFITLQTVVFSIACTLFFWNN